MVFKKRTSRVRRVASSAAGAARRYVSRKGGFGGIMGKFKPVVVGAAGQVAAQVGSNFAGPMGGIAGLAVAGYVGDNETLMTIAGMHLANQFPIGNLLGGSSGGSGSGI